VKGKSTFYVKHIIDKELDIEGSNELEEYVEALGYPTRDTIFGGSDRDILACVLEFEESEIVINMMRNIGFPSRNMIYALLKKRNLSKCLAYSNIKVRNLAFSKLFYEGTLHWLFCFVKRRIYYLAKHKIWRIKDQGIYFYLQSKVEGLRKNNDEKDVEIKRFNEALARFQREN
jgi:hypothetical protein